MQKCASHLINQGGETNVLKRRQPPHADNPSASRRSGSIKNALAASSLLSICVLILIAPDFYHLTSGYVWDFLAARYPPQLLPIAFFALYAVAYPAMYLVGRASWESTAGVAILWIANAIF